MRALVRSTVSGMTQEAALDMTRLGQRLAGKPITPLPVPFITADIVKPQPDPTAVVDPSAVLTGQIYVRRYASIGAGVVLRGDSGVIDVGRYTSIGAGSVIVSAAKKTDNPFARSCLIGHGAKIGSRVVLNNCRIENNVVIGDDCKIGEGAIVEADAVLEAGTVIPAGRLVPKQTKWAGNPAKYLGPAESDHH